LRSGHAFRIHKPNNHTRDSVDLMKKILPFSVIAVSTLLLSAGAWAQQDTGAVASGPRLIAESVTHWSSNVKIFWSHETATWDKNSFDDAVLDTSKLVISRAQVYELVTLSRTFSTYGIENEWNIALGNLTKNDDLLVLDLGFGLLRGSIPKTEVPNHVAAISYYGTGVGHPLEQGTANYTYGIQGSYVGASIPLMVEWRYGMKPVSLNGRLGILYRIASVTVERKLLANGFPQDYDVSMNEGRLAFFNDQEMTEYFNHKISQLVISAIPCVGISMRLPLTSRTETSEGAGVIVGADIGTSTRLYVAVSY
jgi:hypothetical protein